MPVPMVCPQCQADFRGKEIPPADRPSFGGETHFSRVIGIYSHEADATMAWKCPSCGHEWTRTGELPLGFRTFELMSRSYAGPEPGGGEQAPVSVREKYVLAGQPPRKKWWRFWK